MALLTIYAAINLIAALLMYWDKKSAKAKSWRVPEKVLFEIAVLGGGVGATFGMFRFRHKTKHWYFKLGFPILASLQIFLILYVLLP